MNERGESQLVLVPVDSASIQGDLHSIGIVGSSTGAAAVLTTPRGFSSVSH
jgi:hypothetical protein